MKIILLIWLLISPTGETQWLIKQEPTMEQCKTDGEAMQAASEDAIMSKDISDYHGHCQDGIETDKAPQPKGSI